MAGIADKMLNLSLSPNDNEGELLFRTITEFAQLEEYNTDPLQDLTHATNEGAYSSIIDRNLLQGYPTTAPEWSKLVTGDQMLMGVWFCSTLFDGDIPNMSPYGRRMFIFNAEDLLDEDTSLFFDTTYYFEKSKRNQYVRFVATRTDVEWCSNNLTPVDQFENPFLRQDDNGCFSALQNQCGPERRRGQVDFWIEIFIVGDVSLLDNEWRQDIVQRGRFSTGDGTQKGISPIIRRRLNLL